MKLRRNAVFLGAFGEASHQLAKMGGAYLNGPPSPGLKHKFRNVQCRTVNRRRLLPLKCFDKSWAASDENFEGSGWTGQQGV